MIRLQYACVITYFILTPFGCVTLFNFINNPDYRHLFHMIMTTIYNLFLLYYI